MAEPITDEELAEWRRVLDENLVTRRISLDTNVLRSLIARIDALTAERDRSIEVWKEDTAALEKLRTEAVCQRDALLGALAEARLTVNGYLIPHDVFKSAWERAATTEGDEKGKT